MRKAAALLALLFALAVPATASAAIAYQQFGQPSDIGANAMSELTYQVNYQVAPWWGSQPIVWQTGGIPIYWYTYDSQAPQCGGKDGCHGSGKIYVKYSSASDPTQRFEQNTSILSHELMEETVNVFNNKPEIADPVSGHYYFIQNSNTLGADFVFPAYFNHGCGWLDQMRVVSNTC